LHLTGDLLDLGHHLPDLYQRNDTENSDYQGDAAEDLGKQQLRRLVFSIFFQKFQGSFVLFHGDTSFHMDLLSV
jgi:hypothetical protein